MSDDLTAVFRVSATVTEPVKYSALREAVEITSKRFPYFNVSLGSGLFWHFLEFNDKLPRIQAEEDVPCTSFAVTRKDELLYRIIVKGREYVEFIHILTDGGGHSNILNLCFTRTLQLQAIVLIRLTISYFLKLRCRMRNLKTGITNFSVSCLHLLKC